MARRISERGVRKLIERGRIPASRKLGSKAWVIDDSSANQHTRSRRPLTPRSQDAFIHFFGTNTLAGLDSKTKERTAQRIRFLRGSDAPAAVLADWFNGQPPAGLNAGSNFIAHEVAGNDARVRQMLQRRHAAYLRERVDLAQRVSDERAIRGLTRAGLAAAADVDLIVLSAIERGRPVTSIAAIRPVLRALHIEPSAIPRTRCSMTSGLDAYLEGQRVGQFARNAHGRTA